MITPYQTKLKWSYQVLKLISQLLPKLIPQLSNNLAFWTKLKLLTTYVLLLLDKRPMFNTLEMSWLAKMLRLFLKFKLMKHWTILMLFSKNQMELWFQDNTYHLRFHQKKFSSHKNGWLRNVTLQPNQWW